MKAHPTDSPPADSRFAILFNHLTDAVFIHGFDGHFIEVNDTACERLGYSRDELLGMGPRDIDDPASAARVPERIEALRRDGRLLFESVHVARDGTHIPVEIHSQVFEFDGHPVVLSVARDIRKRRAMMQAVQDAQASLRALLDSLPESALLMDEQGTVKALNTVTARRFGTTPDAMLGQNFFGNR